LSGFPEGRKDGGKKGDREGKGDLRYILLGKGEACYGVKGEVRGDARPAHLLTRRTYMRHSMRHTRTTCTAQHRGKLGNRIQPDSAKARLQCSSVRPETTLLRRTTRGGADTCMSMMTVCARLSRRSSAVLRLFVCVWLWHNGMCMSRRRRQIRHRRDG
jgi:hypothetical protein